MGMRVRFNELMMRLRWKVVMRKVSMSFCSCVVLCCVVLCSLVIRLDEVR